MLGTGGEAPAGGLPILGESGINRKEIEGVRTQSPPGVPPRSDQGRRITAIVFAIDQADTKSGPPTPRLGCRLTRCLPRAAPPKAIEPGGACLRGGPNGPTHGSGRAEENSRAEGEPSQTGDREVCVELRCGPRLAQYTWQQPNMHRTQIVSSLATQRHRAVPGIVSPGGSRRLWSRRRTQ